MKEHRLRDIMRRLGVRLENQTKAKGWIEGWCPLAPWTHPKGADRHPSFGVKVEDGISSYHCFTCGHHGRIPGLVRALEHYRGEDHSDDIEYDKLVVEANTADFDAAPELPDFDSLHAFQEPEPEPLEEAIYEDLYPRASEDEAAMAYLRSRGLSPEDADRLGLLFDPEEGHADYINGERVWVARERRILFPVRDRQNNLYGFTGRAIESETKPKVKDYAGLPKKHLILGEHRWYGDMPVILVEGLFAYAHLVSLGIEDYANVGAIMGSKMSDHQIERVETMGMPVYLLFDNDDAGEAGLFGPMDKEGLREWSKGAAIRLKDRLPTMIPAWPDGKCDPDELTHAEVRDMLEQTMPYGAEALVKPVAPPDF